VICGFFLVYIFFKKIAFTFQLVVEKMLAAEGIKRTDLTREEFTKKVWEWKEKSVLLNQD
jgi:valyl-tRNA synthetase